jgi:predicted O-methyltransferase YrrM
LAGEPAEAIEKIRERAASARETLTHRGQRPLYRVDEDWDQRLHGLLGAPWPCPAAAEFPAVWSAVLETMHSKGFRVGRQNYGGDDDSDPGLARALWCLVRHLEPQHVIETGVAHGVSSRCVLEAIERNGAGHLWSIDLPPLTIPERRREIGVAVPADRRGRWTYLEGSTRKRLPALLRELGHVELFWHDSWHSTRNTRWELACAWRALTPGGVVGADDIDHNWGFERFEQSAAGMDALHCLADDHQRLFGIARKRPHDT